MYVCMFVCMYICMYVWMDGWMAGWMDGYNDCIVMKLQMLQKSPLAQTYLVTIEIDLPSDVKKGRHLQFLKVTFEPFEISTPGWCHFVHNRSLFNFGHI
jgi:hypothetical protein